MYRTPEERQRLVAEIVRSIDMPKKEDKIKKVGKALGNYGFGVAYAFDQFVNCLLPFAFGPYAGEKDETISSAMGKLAATNRMKIPWKYPVAKLASGLCNIFEKDHALKSIENDEGKKLDGPTMMAVERYLSRK
jgi:hypothetical protein